MDQVKIRVQSADGKYRGSLFTDGIWDKNRWKGTPKPNLQEVMVCTHELESGTWFLIEYVLPRQIVGEAENGSLFDPASTCCRRTPLQALHWFSQQAFGPPPALVDRVRRFAAKWPSFCSSSSAKAMLETIVQRHFVDGDDPLFSGEAQQNDRALLRDLELVFGSGSSDEGDYHANMLIEDVGVEGFIAWTNRHLDLLSAAGFTAPTRAHVVQGARKGLHDAVIGLAGNLSNLLHLIRRDSPSDSESWRSHGLMWLDQHWLDLDKPPVDDDSSDRSKAWRTTLLMFREHLAVARRLWEQDTAGPDSRLSLDFARVSKGIAACGLLTEATFHGLVITLAKVVLDPRAPGAVPQYALAAIGSGSTNLQTMAAVVRLHTVSDLESRPWWRTMELALEQEYANILSLPSLGNHEPTAVQAPSITPALSHPGNQPPKATVPASDDPAEPSPSPRPLDHTETWILNVLKQEPNRAFKIKDLKAARRRRDQASCPVERSALCDALARLRERELVTYARRTYMHKQ